MLHLGWSKSSMSVGVAETGTAEVSIFRAQKGRNLPDLLSQRQGPKRWMRKGALRLGLRIGDTLTPSAVSTRPD